MKKIFLLVFCLFFLFIIFEVILIFKYKGNVCLDICIMHNVNEEVDITILINDKIVYDDVCTLYVDEGGNEIYFDILHRMGLFVFPGKHSITITSKKLHCK